MLISFSIPTITGTTQVGRCNSPSSCRPSCPQTSRWCGRAASLRGHCPAPFEGQCTCLAGGNEALKKQFGCTIVGPKADEGRIPGIDIALKASCTVVRLLVALQPSTLCWMHRLGGSPVHIRSPHWPCIPCVLSAPAQQQQCSACIWTSAGAPPNKFCCRQCNGRPWSYIICGCGQVKTCCAQLAGPG